MTLRERTIIEPDEIMGSGSMTLSTHSDVAEGFRGVYLELITSDPVAKTEPWLGSFPAGTIDLRLEEKSGSGPNEYGVELGGGVYGDDCLKITARSFTFTVDYQSNDRLVTCTGHTFTDGMRVVASNYGGALPVGTQVDQSFNQPHPRIVVQSATNTFELSIQTSPDFSDDGGDLLATSTAHGYPDNAEIRFWEGGALPDNLSMGTSYWVRSPTTDTYKIATVSSGSALPYVDAGTNDNRAHRWDQGDLVFSDDGTGTHYLTDTGYPSTWIAWGKSNGNGTSSNLKGGNDQFLGPVESRPYNRYEFYIKWPDGFREGTAASDPGQMWHTGTYLCPLDHSDEEYDNYHFYYQLVPRHDQLNGGWLRLLHSEMPTVQRGSAGSEDPGEDPGPLCGANFWSSETRIYLDSIAYAGPSELPSGEYSALIDRMRIFYMDSPYPLSASFDSVNNAKLYYTKHNMNTDEGFSITNSGDSSITGKIKHGYNTALNVTILDDAQSPVLATDDVVIPANTTETFTLRFATTQTSFVNLRASAVVFIPNDEFTANEESHTDANIEIGNGVMTQDYGPADAWRYSCPLDVRPGLAVTFNGSTNTVTATGHTLTTSDSFVIVKGDVADTLPAGLAEWTRYWPVTIGTNTFEIATVEDGSPLTFTGNGTASDGYFRVGNYQTDSGVG